MARLLAGPARLPRSAVAIVLTLLGSSPLHALEKALTVAPQDEAWECASVCGDYLSYYNTCTGWVWAWSGFEPGDVIGHTAAEGDLCFTYMTSRIYVTRGAPPGYGYTGEIRLSNYDDDSCPAGATVRAYPFLPTTGWNVTTWGGVGSAIAHTALIQIVMGEGADNPVALASDVGASGGPPRAGPATRPRASRTASTTERRPTRFARANRSSTAVPSSFSSTSATTASATFSTTATRRSPSAPGSTPAHGGASSLSTDDDDPAHFPPRNTTFSVRATLGAVSRTK